ncbi:hypothetical protein ABZ876_28750 [Streptomyces sp. NPDC046931]|uniref:hypothetical protein n=1 Tax=Streptomyces sp. NPDC046931 TaxID=3154806 RepID=UPI0033D28F4B
MCALEDASPGARQRIPGLPAEAPASAQARSALGGILLGPSVPAHCDKDIGEVRDGAYRILDEPGGDEAYVCVLHRRVDGTSRPLP